jgi:fibronectin-binding autotransporter adhesin
LFTVEGAGNSLVLLHYGATDYAPLQGVSFYRLRQTDFDGKYSFSKVVRVMNSKLSGQSLSLYPNPVQENESIHLKVNTAKADQGNLTISDVLGRLYYSASIDLSKAIDIQKLALQYHLAPGTYLIRIAWGEIFETRKLIVN